ncbi:MAG: FkbM family methyltransferase [Nitrospinae bacterium]|nr:FkbM family methyltransferase [Nitrospinota bacterium]
MENSFFESLLSALPTVSAHHSRGSKLYEVLQISARKEVEASFSDKGDAPKKFGPFGEIVFPYYKMGAIDSLDLFNLDELILFSFYHLNRGRYKRVADVGANIGLHSVIFSKCGFEVRCFEPDPKTFEVLKRNLKANECSKVECHNMAVSVSEGKMEFVRVLGNTTGSHLAGSKANPYGELERFEVNLQPMNPLFAWADLVKMDVEGHEATIITQTKKSHWEKTDGLIEIENAKNAEEVFNHLNKEGVNLFSQKNNWKRVRELSQMPVTYKEGMLFASCKTEMPWQ